MPASLITTIERVDDPQAHVEYKARVPDLVARHGGSCLVRSDRLPAPLGHHGHDPGGRRQPIQTLRLFTRSGVICRTTRSDWIVGA